METISVAKENFKSVSVYNVRTHRALKLKLSKGVPVSFPSLILVADKLYIVGGCLMYGYTASTFCVQLDSPNTFENRANMSHQRCGHTLAQLGQAWIYAVGGYSGSLDYLRECEKYSVLSDKWTSIPSLTEGKTLPSLCFINSRLLYCLGGYPYNDKSPGNHIESLDTADEESGWSRFTFAQPRDLDQWDSRCGFLSVQVSPFSLLLFGGKFMLNGGQYAVLDLRAQGKSCFDVCGYVLPGYWTATMCCRGVVYSGCAKDNVVYRYCIKNKTWECEAGKFKRPKPAAGFFGNLL